LETDDQKIDEKKKSPFKKASNKEVTNQPLLLDLDFGGSSTVQAATTNGQANEGWSNWAAFDNGSTNI
jgi:hypothetical protein